MGITIWFPKEIEHENTVQYFERVAEMDSDIEVKMHPKNGAGLFCLAIEGLNNEKFEFTLRCLDFRRYAPRQYQRIVRGLRWLDPYLTQFESQGYSVAEIQILNMDQKDYGNAGIDIEARIIKLLPKRFSHKKWLIHDFLHELGHILQDDELGYISEDEQLMLDLFQKYLLGTDIPETFAKVIDLSS